MANFKKNTIQTFKHLKLIPSWIYLVAILIIGFALRFFNITKASIWHDEGYTAMLINLSPAEIIKTTITDVHPPLYYLILHWWQDFFGSSLVSLRSFSMVCGLLIVIFTYLLMRKLFSERVARFAGLLTAIGPFLIRYSQEARMYSFAALIAIVATYVFVIALSKKKAYGWWLFYGVIIAAGLYTQYYLALLVFAHLIYAVMSSKTILKGLQTTLKNTGVWLSAIVAILLFSPWIAPAINQVTRVDSGFWIPPISWFDIPNAISMFMTYNHDVTAWLGITFAAAMIILIIWLANKNKNLSAPIWLLLSWAFLPMIIVALLSIRSPIFYDRYFAFSAPAFYALLAVIVSYIPLQKTKLINFRYLIGTVIIVILIFGVSNVYNAAGHKMKNIAEVVNHNYQNGDEIISAELYTFFDFSYYNQTGQGVKLLSNGPFGKYGEWGLVRATNTERVSSFDEVSSKRVWLVGKTGEHDYFEKEIPSNWKLQKTTEAGDSAVRLYSLNEG